MTAKNALRFTAIMTGLSGAALIIRPEWILDVFEFSAAGEVDYWLRRFGVAFVAITIVFWAASRFPSSIMQRPVLWAGTVLALSMFVLSMIAILDHRMNALFWGVAGYELLLAVWFGWLLVLERV